MDVCVEHSRVVCVNNPTKQRYTYGSILSYNIHENIENVWGYFCQKIPHIFLYRDEYGYISIQREKVEAKLGYIQITPIIIVDP